MPAPPLATIALHGQVLRIAHLDRSALAQGVREGQTLADAKAICPRLVTVEDDPPADRRELESLAVWADRFSPIVQIEDERTLLADVTGCERLFRGERNLLRQAVEGLGELGFAARCAIADTPGAAWALAHAHPESMALSEPDQTSADLAPLPVWSLRIDPATTASLQQVGVETIESLLYLPRFSLTSRFGEGLLDRLDQALGNQMEALAPYRPPPVLTSRVAIGRATDRRDVLREATEQALQKFCQRLEKQVAGTRQVFVTFYCPDIPEESGTRTRTVTLHADLSQPTRSPRHMGMLLGVLLEGLQLPGPADVVMVWTREIENLDGWQDELFITDAGDRRALGDLLDRLALRLGAEAVTRPEPVSDHQPEKAYRYVSLVGGRASLPLVQHSARRPLQLLPRPVDVEVTALAADGPPVSLRLQGRQQLVTASVGPERIETGWWRGRHIRRDYYRVTTGDGRRAWIFRRHDGRRWFLHGWFD